MLYVYDMNDNTKILSVSSFGFWEDSEIASERLEKLFETLVFIGFDKQRSKI